MSFQNSKFFGILFSRQKQPISRVSRVSYCCDCSFLLPFLKISWFFIINLQVSFISGLRSGEQVENWKLWIRSSTYESYFKIHEHKANLTSDPPNKTEWLLKTFSVGPWGNGKLFQNPLGNSREHSEESTGLLFMAVPPSIKRFWYLKTQLETIFQNSWDFIKTGPYTATATTTTATTITITSTTTTNNCCVCSCFWLSLLGGPWRLGPIVTSTRRHPSSAQQPVNVGADSSILSSVVTKLRHRDTCVQQVEYTTQCNALLLDTVGTTYTI